MNQQFYKNLALWVVILVVMLLLFTTLKQNEATPPNIAFSEFMEQVTTNQVEGEGLCVKATPTLFVNGRMVVGVKTFEEWKLIIEEELATVERG